MVWSPVQKADPPSTTATAHFLSLCTFAPENLQLSSWTSVFNFCCWNNAYFNFEKKCIFATKSFEFVSNWKFAACQTLNTCIQFCLWEFAVFHTLYKHIQFCPWKLVFSKSNKATQFYRLYAKRDGFWLGGDDDVLPHGRWWQRHQQHCLSPLPQSHCSRCLACTCTSSMLRCWLCLVCSLFQFDDRC